MKLVSFWLVLVSFFSTNIVLAAEQKIIFNVESLKTNVSQSSCTRDCSKYNDESVSELMNKGWRIVNSFPKEAIGLVDHRYNCMCVGTQYVMQKDDPTPVMASNVPSKAEELLKQENDLLKREISVLKQENDSLKAKIKPKQKKK